MKWKDFQQVEKYGSGLAEPGTVECSLVKGSLKRPGRVAIDLRCLSMSYVFIGQGSFITRPDGAGLMTLEMQHLLDGLSSVASRQGELAIFSRHRSLPAE
jgi:hypothetical protein